MFTFPDLGFLESDYLKREDIQLSENIKQVGTRRVHISLSELGQDVIKVLYKRGEQ